MKKAFVLTEKETVEAIVTYVAQREATSLEGEMHIVINRKGRDGIDSVVLEIVTLDAEVMASS